MVWEALLIVGLRAEPSGGNTDPNCVSGWSESVRGPVTWQR
jgi:hypothetical protein